MTVCGAAIVAPRDFTSHDPLPIGIGLGPPLGHPSVTQGPPKPHARITLASICGSAFVFNKGWKKAGWGGLAEGHRQRDVARESAPIAGIAVIARNPKPKPNTEALRHGERARAEDRNS